MLQDVRKSMQGTTAKVIVWAIAITFALFGVESIVGGIGGEPEIAEVNGEGIPESQFAVALERKKRQLLTQMGENADPDLLDNELLSKSILDGMVQTKILEQDAVEKGLYVSTGMIDEYIRNMNEFKVDGSFSNDRLQSLLNSNGFTLQGFRNSLRDQFLVNQGRSALIGSAYVLDNEQSELIAIDRQTRDFGYVILNRDDYVAESELSDAEVATYYEANAEQFVKPEQVDVEYIVLSRDVAKAGVSVTKEEIESRYQQELNEFVGDEERRAAHILISITDEMAEQDALAKATELKARLDAGEEFSELAKVESDDEGSAVEGGDLGFSGKGVYVAEFEDALFSMNEGQVTEPVKTEFGFHIIKLLAIQENEPPGLDVRAAAIEEDLILERTAQVFVEMGQTLADITYSSPDLTDAAEELNLEVKERFGVSVETTDPLFAAFKLQRALFDDENLSGEHNSEVIEIDEDTSVVFRVLEHRSESQKSIDEVREEIKDQLIATKATEYAMNLANAFIVRVDTGEDPELVADDMGFAWNEKDGVRRDDFSLEPQMMFKVFAMPSPSRDERSVDGFELPDGDYAVAVLNAVNDGSVDDITMIERQSITGALGGSFGGSDYNAYLESLEGAAEVERL